MTPRAHPVPLAIWMVFIGLSACVPTPTASPSPAITSTITQAPATPTTGPGALLRITLTGAVVSDLIDSEWRLVEAPGVTLPEPNPATLEILSDRIAGYDGCNWYRGDYASTGDRLVWSGLVVTVRGCEPEWMSLEEIFLERVREAVAWRVSGDRLELRNASGALRLAFARREPAPVTGADLSGLWAWAESSLAPARPWIAFEGTQFTGHTGCRGFAGEYTTKGDRLTFSTYAMISDDCTSAGLSLELERPVMEALEAVAYFSRDGDRLVLETTTLTRSVWVRVEALSLTPAVETPPPVVTGTPPRPTAPTATGVQPGPTSTVVSPGPTPGAGPVITPTITAFTVAPTIAERGEALTLAWASTDGLTATLQHRGPNSWWGTVITGTFPVSGTTVISNTLKDEGRTGFILTVYGQGGGWAQQEVIVTFPCLYTFFFTDRDLGACPLSPARDSTIVMQRFERGWMIWFPHDTGGTVTVLYDGGRIATLADSWTEDQPANDPTLTPPPDLLQPVRGFGLVWRTQPGVRDGLGWAVVPEGPYTTQIQSRSTGGDWKGIDYYFRIWDGRIVHVTGRTMPGQWAFIEP